MFATNISTFPFFGLLPHLLSSFGIDAEKFYDDMTVVMFRIDGEI